VAENLGPKPLPGQAARDAIRKMPQNPVAFHQILATDLRTP
jgi:hypothetical protein